MADYGTNYTEKELKKLEKQIDEIYTEAHNDVSMKMKEFNLNWVNKEMPVWQSKLNSGEITQKDYDKWFAGKAFQSQEWQAKEEQIYNVLYNANTEAINILNGGKISVFAENSNWAFYDMEHNTGVNFGFGIYDSTTVTKLLKENPTILPKYKVNEQKDYVWNKKKANSVITQGIVQGKDLQSITKDLSNKLVSQNYNLMKTHARTAMTSAQNAGRYQALMDAKDLGIDVYKEWMATLDEHTRDSHANMDGEQQKVGDKWHPFKFSNGCRYPGDPEGPPEEVYNCRCTMVGDIDDYPSKYERRDNIDGEPIENMTYNEWYSAKQHYKELTEQYGTLEDAKDKLDSLQYLADNAPIAIDKVFSNIWKEDVTFADWEDKKDSIQAKKDYYDQQIIKYSEQLANDPNAPQWVSDKLDKFLDLSEQLEEFEKYGEKYSQLLSDIENAKETVRLLDPTAISTTSYNEALYSQDRKDAAKWFTSSTYRQGDKYYSSWSESIHQLATTAEKNAYYSYTSASGGFNRPLAGFDYSKSGYGDGWNPKNYVGPGNVGLNNEGKGRQIDALTSFVEKSQLPDDVWVQTAQGYGTLEGFLGVDYGSLSSTRGDNSALQQHVGTVAEFPQFVSGSINRGGGPYTPGEVRFNIYLPQGSEALYVMNDGAFGKHEHEIILQRGGTYRITNMYWGQDVEKGGTKLMVDMDLLLDMGYDKYK